MTGYNGGRGRETGLEYNLLMTLPYKRLMMQQNLKVLVVSVLSDTLLYSFGFSAWGIYCIHCISKYLIYSRKFHA